MQDRKTETIITRLVAANKNINDMKGTQPIGADNTVINMMSSEDAYDYTVTIPGSGTTRFYADLRFFPFDLKPWQPSDYSKLYVQTWVGNMSTPYNGTQHTNLIIFDMRMNTSLFVNQAVWSLNNVSGSNKTVFFKFYAISTAMNGTITFSGYLG